MTMSLLETISMKINRASEALLFVLMISMVFLTVLQILCRVFFQALIWSEELIRFLLVASSLVGAAVAFYRGSHISITFLIDRLPGRIRLWLQLSVRLLSLAFFAVVAWFGWALMGTEAFQTTPAMGLSMKWIYAMYPVFGVVVAIHLMAGIGKVLRGNS